ncbi:MAG: ABC transporter permease [Bacteroidales bacterium]
MINPLIYGFRVSFRRLFKERKFTLINTSGLAVSMAAALLIFLYLLFETSYDKHHHNHQNIYRLATQVAMGGETHAMAMNSAAMGPLLVEQVPEITDYLRIFPANFFFRNLIYRYRDKSFHENRVQAVDSTFFDFFTYTFLYGNPETALTTPFSLVMTERMAQRYFGDEPPLGKVIEVEGAGHFTVTAVVSNPLPNSHMFLDGMFSISTLYHLEHLISKGYLHGSSWPFLQQSFDNRIIWLYVKTQPGFDPDEFLRNRWLPLHESHIGGSGGEETLLFQPLADIHLTSKLAYEMTNQTNTVTMMNPDLIRIFTLIGILLLVLAAINYTNISISRFQQRGKEMGVKKVVGALKKDLVIQFLAESILTSLVAFFLALLLIEILLPEINRLLRVPLSLNIFQNLNLILLFGAIALFTGIVSGLYPAVYFASASPLRALNKRFGAGKGSLGLKKILIVVQFMISVFMVVATIVVWQQLAYITNRDLGFDPHNVVIVELTDQTSRQNARAIRDELLQNPGFKDAALSNYFPSRISFSHAMDVMINNQKLQVVANIAQVDPHFTAFMGIGLAEGRFFDADNPSDFHSAALINRTAQKLFQWDNPIGQSIEMNFTWPDGIFTGNRKVIGVMEDFHFASRTRSIEPMIFFPMTEQAAYINLRIEEGKTAEALGFLTDQWQKMRQGYPLTFFFLDRTIVFMYHSQRILSLFFAAFAVLCIFIAFLGLYGLSAYSIEQRTREIGIRKVLGANTAEIMYLLAKEFLLLITVAGLLASGIAWIFLQQWLGGFAYHTHLGIIPFIAGLLSAYVVAMLAVVVHVRKASRLNPAQAVRYE